MTYLACKKFIETGLRLGNLDVYGMKQKLDIFLQGNRITMTEYSELIKMLEE